MIPVLAGLTILVWSRGSLPPQGGELIALTLFAVAMIGLPAFGYAYTERYRVRVDGQGLTLVSLFRERRINFSDVGEIATVRGKGVDYWLFSRAHERLAVIGGSVEDFESPRNDVESATRSSSVTLYEFETLRGWQERANDLNDDWRKSKGPPSIRDRNRRVHILLAAAVVIIILLLAFQHLYLP
jgi:hypothetical protein